MQESPLIIHMLYDFRATNQIKELSTLFDDFTAEVSLAAGKAAIRIWHPPTADPLIP